MLFVIKFIGISVEVVSGIIVLDTARNATTILHHRVTGSYFAMISAGVNGIMHNGSTARVL